MRILINKKATEMYYEKINWLEKCGVFFTLKLISKLRSTG
jgi:hypothetical protein